MAQNYKKDFNGQNIFVGIDVHLKTWSVSIALPSGYLKTQDTEVPDPFVSRINVYK